MTSVCIAVNGLAEYGGQGAGRFCQVQLRVEERGGGKESQIIRQNALFERAVRVWYGTHSFLPFSVYLDNLIS